MSAPAPKRFEVVTPHGAVDVTLEWPDKAAAWYYRFTLKGQRHYRTTKSKDAKEARKVTDKAVRDAMNAEAPTVAAMPLFTTLEKYLLEKEPTAGGHGIRTRLERFRDFAKDRNLAAMNEEGVTHLVQRFVDFRKEGIDPITVRNERVEISTFFSWVMGLKDEHGARLISWRVNPAYAKLVKCPRVVTKILPPVSPEVLKKLLAVSRPTELYPAIVLMLSGLRPIGVTNITWEKISLGEHPQAQALEKNEQRTIALSNWAATELKAWKAENPDKPVVPSGDASVVHRKLKMLRQLAGIPEGTTLQALRRTADFKLYQAGVDPQSAAKILNHSVMTAMSHYVNFKHLDAKGAVQHLDFSSASEKESEK